jgi:hypothetical protein
MKTLQLLVLGVSLLGLTSCAHNSGSHDGAKSCKSKDGKSCDVKKKKSCCKTKKKCDGKSCEVKK